MILDRIVNEKKGEVTRLQAPRASLFEALSEPGLSMIAEIKRASPSKGIIAEDFDPSNQMEAYVTGGASAVSVLTDQTFFKGSRSILKDLSERSEIPLLRKDFLIDPLQVDESYFLGADAVLLITSILEDLMLKEMLDRIHSFGMEALVEVHDEEDLYRVLETSAKVIGINNRNLKDFTVNLGTTEKLVNLMDRLGSRSGKRIVSESGILSREHSARLEDAGVDGILVGESLMLSPDPAALISELKGRCIP